MQALTFRDTQFDITDRKGQPWLQSTQIASALGYASEDAVSRIYRRNSDEFTPCMTETVKLTVSGNLQKEVRIFSLRGAHLLAMFARTEVAKEFRRWVLDVLDGLAEAPVLRPRQAATPKALPGLNREQQVALKEMVAARVSTLPITKQRGAAMRCWSALKAKFGCGYKEIEPAQFTEAVHLVARVELEGEWLGKPGNFAGVIGRPLSPIERWMISLDPQGQERYTPIPVDACVMTHRELIKAMVTPGALDVSTEEMFEFSMAALANLKARSASQGMRQQQLSDRRR